MPLDTKQIGWSIGLIGGALYLLKKRRDAHKFQIISCSQCGSLSDAGCDFCGDCMSCCMCYQFHAEDYDLSLHDPSIHSKALGLFKIDKENIGLTSLNDTTHLAIHDWDPYPDELPVDDKIVHQYDFYGVDNKGRTYFGDGFLIKEDLFPYGDLMLENAEIGGEFYNVGFILNEEDAWFVAESFDAETWITEHPTRDKSEVVCVKCKSPAHDCWCERCPQCEEFWNDAWINCESCFSCDECCKKSCPELWDAESLDAEEWRKHYEIHGTMAGDDGRCVRCGSNAGFDYAGGCLTCLDVASQELPLNEDNYKLGNYADYESLELDTHSYLMSVGHSQSEAEDLIKRYEAFIEVGFENGDSPYEIGISITENERLDNEAESFEAERKPNQCMHCNEVLYEIEVWEDFRCPHCNNSIGDIYSDKISYDDYMSAESFEAEDEPIFGDWQEGVVMMADGSLLVKVVSFPAPNSDEFVGESMWVIVKKGNEYEGKGYLANEPNHSSLKFGTLIEYGEGTNTQKPVFKGFDETDIITKEQILDPKFKGILRTTPDEYFENEIQIFGDEDEELLQSINEMGLLYSIDNKLWNKKIKGFEAESFAASPPAIFEDDERGPREPRHDCAICGRPYTISRLGRELIQHYLKESENGTLEFKSKEFPNGTRRTARTVAGYFLYREGLDALNEYVLYAPKSNLSPKIEELLKSSLVQRIVAGDVVNLIEMLELDDRTDDSPTFGESFEKEFEAEGFK